MSLEDKIDQLFGKINVLNKEVLELKLENKVIKQENSQLHAKVKVLENKFHKKNSSNSSIAPSKDENRVKPNQSLREKSGKNTGGQQGHKGNTLKMYDDVDHITEHKMNFCICCGDRLSTDQKLEGKHQVIDIPPIKPIVTEHRIYSTVCTCGKTNASKYPKEALAPVSYGSTVEAMIGYLSVRQYMPMERIAELFHQVLNIRISQGTIRNKIASLANGCMPMYKQIKYRIERSKVVGADETGCVVNGNKWWMWTWQNPTLTYIAASESRGFKAITDNFSNGLTNAILVSDCWAAQLKTPAHLHQICLAHIQRELKYFIERNQSRWSTEFLKLIYRALDLKKEIQQKGLQGIRHRIIKVKNDGTLLLNQIIKGPKKLRALINRLIKHKDSLWVFLDHIEVPPDNNGSERAIRNVKVKQKISGQFRSQNGAHEFAVIRSVIDTTIKNKGNIFDTLALIPNFVPE
jgi:transposase